MLGRYYLCLIKNNLLSAGLKSEYVRGYGRLYSTGSLQVPRVQMIAQRQGRLSYSHRGKAKTVANLNIAHFKTLLATETDPVKHTQSNTFWPGRGEAGTHNRQNERTRQKLAVLPRPPVRRINEDTLAGQSYEPAVGDPSASKDESMNPILLNDRELKIAVIRRRCNRFPDLRVVHCPYTL